MTQPRTQLDYDRIWSETYGDMQNVGPAHKHMDRIFRRILRNISYETVLDVGCGTGRNIALLREGRFLREIVGIDISGAAIERIRCSQQASFHRMDIQKERLNGAWDLVFCSLLLEHVSDDVAALKNLRAMTGHHLLLSTISGSFERYKAWEQKVGHVRNYKHGELESKLDQAGFKVRQAVRWGFPFFSPLARLLQNHATPKTDMGIAARAAASFMYWLYFLNLSGKGDLLVILAEV